VPEKDVYHEGEICAYVFNRYGPYHEGEFLRPVVPSFEEEEKFLEIGKYVSMYPEMNFVAFESVCDSCPRCSDNSRVCPEHQVMVAGSQFEELLRQGPRPNLPPYILFP
jgi:hypothetical protein